MRHCTYAFRHMCSVCVCVCVFSKDAIVYGLSCGCLWSTRLLMFNEFPDALLQQKSHVLYFPVNPPVNLGVTVRLCALLLHSS